MANQIKKKYIQNGAVDGEKLKLVKDQSVRGEDQSGQEVDLLKLDQDDKVLLKGEEAAFKSQVDAEQVRAEGEESRIEGLVSAEEVRAMAEELRLAGLISAEEQARIAGDSDLDAKIQTEKARIDAILSASEADKDSFAEIVNLINSVDTENDQAFAGYVASNDARVLEAETDIESLDSRVTILEEDKEVVEIDSLATAPSLGLQGKLYLSKDTNKLYRWATTGGGSLEFDLTVGAGEAYDTLEAAIAAAVDGDNILVKAGTYSVASTINVNKKVKIVGEDKDTVIFQTAGASNDPTSMFNISVDDVVLAKLSIKHKKTSNTSIETAVVASGGGWPQTRIKNFLLEDCYVEFVETGVAVRAEGWCVRDCTLAYGTGSASNSARAIIMYGTKGDSFIKSNVLKNDIIDTSSFRPLYLSSTNGSNPNETSEGKLVIEGMTQLGSLSQFFNQDNLQSAGAGTFELQIKNNTINESNLFAGFASYVQNAGDMFSSITLSGNSISNNHNATGGKGLYGVYGNTDFRSSALVVHADNNTIGQDVYRDGWESVQDSLIGKETAVPAFSVSLDSVIPASGDAPSVGGGSTSEYVEVSEQADLSQIESDLSDEIAAREAGDAALQSQIDSLVQFGKESIEVTAQMITDEYVDLQVEIKPNSMVMFVDRLGMHEGLDYSVSTVNGVSRITFLSPMLQPSEEALEAGQFIRVTYGK